MPMTYSVNTDLSAVFDDVAETAEKNARIAFGNALVSMANEAKKLAPNKSGALAGSIRAGDVQGKLLDGSMHGYVSATAPHAEAHEYGSGIHGERGAKYPIVPRFKKSLRWAIGGSIGGGDAGFAFAKKVMHPGVKASRYLQQGVEAKLPVLTEELAAAVALAFEEG